MYTDRPLTRFLLEKRAALPPTEQTQALVAHGEKKKRGLGTGTKLLAGAGALALGLGTGKLQLAGKALKNVMKNPTTGKFDPIGAVGRGYKNMGNTAESTKRIQTSKDIIGGLESGVVRKAGQTSEGITGALRKRGILSKNNQVIGNLDDAGKAAVQKSLQKEMPHLFDNAGKLDLSKLSPQQLAAAEKRFLELAQKQNLGGLTTGQKFTNMAGAVLPGETALIGGLSAAGAAGELTTKQDADGRRRSLGERMLRAGTVGAAGIALNPLFGAAGGGLIPGMIAFEAGNRAAAGVGGLAGRGVTAITGGEYGSPVDEVKSHIPFAGGH